MSPPAGHGTSTTDEFDPDEPRTPLWLPLLGLCLFVAALIYVLVGQKPPPEEVPALADSAAASASAAPAPAAKPE